MDDPQQHVIDDLLQAGLLQFGLFGDSVPFLISLELLPSYPDILARLVDLAVQQVDMGRYDRLVCTVDAVPFGVAVSVKTGIPLVYSRGTNQSGVRDLVGAYDVGHPALLLCNVWAGDGYTLDLIDKARKVGLEIDTAVALLDMRNMPVDAVLLRPILRFNETVAHLAEIGRIPAGQAAAVQAWITG
ncbi:MAG: hypothetical protein OHK0046_27670 [Anaerolineae bacterium]